VIEPAGVVALARSTLNPQARSMPAAGAIGAAGGDGLDVPVGAVGSDRFNEKSTPPSAAPHCSAPAPVRFPGRRRARERNRRDSRLQIRCCRFNR
jgi:hypothetical protein